MAAATAAATAEAGAADAVTAAAMAAAGAADAATTAAEAGAAEDTEVSLATTTSQPCVSLPLLAL